MLNLKTWACGLGFHDWVIIEHVNQMEVEKKLNKKLSNINFTTTISTEILEHKRCDRCGIEINEINDHSIEYVNKLIKRDI